MPKCGGTSVRLALESLLGAHHLSLDYIGLHGATELARYQQLLQYIDNPEPLANNTCVYGHFRAVKYLGSCSCSTDDILLFTILREPINRLISHYRYLIALDDSANPMRSALRDHQDDFAWFAMQPRLRNIYARHLYQIPISRVTYFGIYEFLDLSWSQIASIIRPGSQVSPLPKLNATSDRLSFHIPRPDISDLLLSELHDIHAEDVALYNYILDSKFKNYQP